MENVREIIESYLKENGFDGLFNQGECACVLGDLFVCDESFPDCEPGYKSVCDCGEHVWHVSRERQG